MSTPLVFVISGAVALILLLTVIMILTRYKKCKSDELLIVYGKTSKKKLKSSKEGEKVEIDSSNCKCIQGGAKFIIPVIQGYSIMKMTPKQIVCNLTNALDLQKIETSVKTVITVAISKTPTVQINAATRLLGLDDRETNSLISEICFGQLRLVVSEMLLEDLVNSRDKFLELCKTRIGSELEKIGFDLININISEISDNAHYLENLGKSAEARATFTAKSEIEKRTKEGEIAIATQKQEKEVKLSEISRDKEIQVSENKKQQDIKTAEIERDRVTTTEKTRRDQEVTLRDIERDKNTALAEKIKEEAVAVRGVEKDKEIETANLEKEEAERKSEIERDKQITIAANQSEQAQKVAEQKRLEDAGVAEQKAQAETAVATANADRDAKIAEQESKSQAAQAKSRQDAAASVVEAEQSAEARKETAKQEAIAKKKEAEQKSESAQAKATQEKEAQIAEFDSDRRKRTAEAGKTATITENTAGIEIAKSNADLGKEQAEAQKIIGESKANAEKAVGIAQAKKEEEVALAEAKAEKAKQEATIMVGTEIEADRKRAEAKGKKDATVTEAEGEAEAILLKAKAEAEKIKLTKLAEAEGAKMMAEAKKVEMQAETEGIANLARADVPESVAVSYILKDKWEGMIGAEMAKFEHINLGNVTVVGGSEKAAEFMGNIASMVQGATGLGSENVPGVMGIIGKLMNFDKKNQIQQPTEEPEQPQEEALEESK